MNLHWLFAFGLTQLIEAPIYFLALERLGPERPRTELALLATLPSALTHPLLWFALFHPTYEALGYWPAVVVCELIVAITETLVLYALTRSSWRKAALWAFGANFASVMTGFATQELFGWP